jgi:hypothetical protein
MTDGKFWCAKCFTCGKLLPQHKAREGRLCSCQRLKGVRLVCRWDSGRNIYVFDCGLWDRLWIGMWHYPAWVRWMKRKKQENNSAKEGGKA